MAPRKYTYYTFTGRDPVIDETWALVQDRLENGSGQKRGALKRFADEANISTTTLYNMKKKKTRNAYYSTIANLWSACGRRTITINPKARGDK